MAGTVDAPVIVPESDEQLGTEHNPVKGATSSAVAVSRRKTFIAKSHLFSKLLPISSKISIQAKKDELDENAIAKQEEPDTGQRNGQGEPIPEQGDKTQPKGPRITDLPLDIIYYIAELIDPADRYILRYTCRAFYESVPMLDADPFSLCLKTLVTARLFHSDLLPEFKTDNGTRDMTLPEIKKFLLDRTDCKFCEAFNPKYSPSFCPFHWFIDPRGKMPAARTSPERSLYRRGWFRSLGIDRIADEDGYCRFLEKAAFEDSFGFTALDSGFTRSWQRAIQDFENRRRWLHTAREIMILNCCAHCLNVLPGNDGGRKCPYCYCSACGFAPVHIVRAEGWGSGRPKYIPIGRMRGRETEFTRKGRVLEFVNDSLAVVGSVFYR
ncbi:hypothetical protein VTN00DRAFT_5850 [Thermoascus crustaceus]|uniref:uncharacterized protein n=1 Tax=Thermoascus crustaceus TaxID=5088 RepID=UPI003741E943